MKNVLLNDNDHVITVEPDATLCDSVADDKIVIGKDRRTDKLYLITEEVANECGAVNYVMVARSLQYDTSATEYDNMKDLLMDYEVWVFDDYAELGCYLR